MIAFRDVAALCLVGLLLSSCSQYYKAMNSQDYELKYAVGMKNYEQKKYAKSEQLLKDCVYFMKGTNKADKVIYFYSMSAFNRKNYFAASGGFQLIVSNYPASIYYKEALYHAAYCAYLEVPYVEFDQTTTQTAISIFESYKNSYPKDEKIPLVEQYLHEMREQIALKSFLIAKQYHRLGHYDAAVVALINCRNSFPRAGFRKELSFLILDSKYRLALNSSQEKKRERLISTLDESIAFAEEFKEEESTYYRKAAEIGANVREYLGGEFASTSTENEKEEP